MARRPQTARSERTRDALRRAALVRFIAQGFDATTAEQIAGDAGVTLRTFYRHFSSKHDLLFPDYDAHLSWFREALAESGPDEPITRSVQRAVQKFPFDHSMVADVAALREVELDRERIERHIRQVEADFAAEIEHYLLRSATNRIEQSADDLLLTSVTAHCVAAAVFAAMGVWMRGRHESLDELARLCARALAALESGLILRLES
ncbi:TetR/AcrR family transcriptional regulator [Nocardia sp. NBC_00565]|uniref:TetR family transcriptional regulator n=1 Tax=Nocardia sp. NBC_00565 TaxID=2975993 RepID=UPI002E81500D|nr:TetR family transcriptional regulator [Nocardia sp. NBC_00565]WUC06434.1 TetR/AcrR family transcriptional regulator [Nocardia sp. NBC_00565]